MPLTSAASFLTDPKEKALDAEVTEPPSAAYSAAAQYNLFSPPTRFLGLAAVSVGGFMNYSRRFIKICSLRGILRNEDCVPIRSAQAKLYTAEILPGQNFHRKGLGTRSKKKHPDAS